MGHETLDPDPLRVLQSMDRGLDLRHRESQPGHAGVDLDVDGQRRPIFVVRERGERAHLLAGGDHRSEAEPLERFELPGREPGEHQDRRGDAGLPQGDAFVHVGDREHGDPERVEGAGHLDRSVSVRVRLQHGNDRARAGMAAEGLEVVADPVEVHPRGGGVV